MQVFVCDKSFDQGRIVEHVSACRVTKHPLKGPIKSYKNLKDKFYVSGSQTLVGIQIS